MNSNFIDSNNAFLIDLFHLLNITFSWLWLIHYLNYLILLLLHTSDFWNLLLLILHNNHLGLRMLLSYHAVHLLNNIKALISGIWQPCCIPCDRRKTSTVSNDCSLICLITSIVKIKLPLLNSWNLTVSREDRGRSKTITITLTGLNGVYFGRDIVFAFFLSKLLDNL